MKTHAMLTIYPGLTGEEFKPETAERTQPAGKASGVQSEIEKAERYFKALREIEFITLII
jgi:hypothetical protein